LKNPGQHGGQEKPYLNGHAMDFSSEPCIPDQFGKFDSLHIFPLFAVTLVYAPPPAPPPMPPAPTCDTHFASPFLNETNVSTHAFAALPHSQC
jgi:hypothetical protein